MYKKSRLVAKKHRLKQARRIEQRKLAHRLLKGDLRLDETERMVGDGYQGVLRTVAYLGDALGIPIPAGITSAVSAVVSPAFSGTGIPTKAKVIPAEAPIRPRRTRAARPLGSDEGRVMGSGSQTESNEESVATAVDSPAPKARTASRRVASSAGSSAAPSSQNVSGDDASVPQKPRSGRARGTVGTPKARAKPKTVAAETSGEESEPKPVRRRASKAKESE